MIGGKEVDVIIDPSGKLLATQPQGGAPAEKPEKAKKDGPARLTPAAIAAIKKVYPKATVQSVSVESVGPPILLKANLKEGASDREVEVTPDGILVSTQIDVALKDVPKSVQVAIRKATGTARVGKVEREDIFAAFDPNGNYEPLKTARVIYEAKIYQGGARREVQVAADGRTLEVESKGWRSKFNVDKKNLVSVGRNPYFILIPGHKIHLSSGSETVIISVLNETKLVDGVETRIVEERESENGKLVEVSRNYFAMDKTTSDVYYFGEDVNMYKDGKVVGHGGAWLSGINGAKFGLIMPGKPVVGDQYYQEIAPTQAMDRAENVTLDARLKTPLKAFTKVLYIRETNPLEPGDVSHKWYVAGIGMIGDDELRLIKVETPKGR